MDLHYDQEEELAESEARQYEAEKDQLQEPSPDEVTLSQREALEAFDKCDAKVAPAQDPAPCLHSCLHLLRIWTGTMTRRRSLLGLRPDSMRLRRISFRMRHAMRLLCHQWYDGTACGQYVVFVKHD